MYPIQREVAIFLVTSCYVHVFTGLSSGRVGHLWLVCDFILKRLACSLCIQFNIHELFVLISIYIFHRAVSIFLTRQGDEESTCTQGKLFTGCVNVLFFHQSSQGSNT